ncbi:MAG: V-type ATP synthase subunit I [Candidatus Syntropharchaeia archaeon]
MFRPAEMMEVRAVVLDRYADSVVNAMEEVGSVHLVDVREDLEEWEGLVEPSRGDPTLNRCSDLLSRINGVIDILGPEEKKKGISNLFKEEKIEKVVIEEEDIEEVERNFKKIEGEVLEISSHLEALKEESSELEFVMNNIEILDKMGIDLDYIGSFDFTSVFAGSIPSENLSELKNFLEETSKEYHVLVSQPLSEGEAFVVIATLRAYADELEKFLRIGDFISFVPPDYLPTKASEALSTVRSKIEEIKKKIKKFEDDLKRINAEERKNLLVMKEIVQIEEERARVKLLFGETERVCLIQGYVPKKKMEETKEKISLASENCSIVSFSEPEKEEGVPTLLENPKIIRPFELIVNAHSIPKYTDIDPTLLIAIIYPILFGFMFPDVGHGIILFLLGVILAFFMKGLGRGVRELGAILIPCGIVSAVVGVLFGEVFGFGEPAAETTHHLSPVIMNPIWFDPIGEGTTLPLIGSIEQGIICMFAISLGIGIIHISIGMIMNIANKIRMGEIREALLGPGIQLWFYTGLAFELMYLIVKGGFWLGNFALVTIWMLVPLFLIFVLGTMESMHEFSSEGSSGIMTRFMGIFGGLIEVLDVFSRFLSNTISYGRILAMALCHMILMIVTIMIAYIFLGFGAAGLPLWAIIIILGNIVVIGFELLLVTIQDVRLHFYEWFTKFYDGGGIEFKPFRISRIYTSKK